MARTSEVLSVSLPTNLTKAVDELARMTDSNRSELVRSALREYITDSSEDRARFVEAYKATRSEKTITLDQLKKKYQL